MPMELYSALISEDQKDRNLRDNTAKIKHSGAFKGAPSKINRVLMILTFGCIVPLQVQEKGLHFCFYLKMQKKVQRVQSQTLTKVCTHSN